MKQIISDHKITVSLEKVENPEHSSFHTGVYNQPYFSGAWHYHPEFELLLITKGSGRRLVGDQAEDFESNDRVLLGGDLPQAWIPDPMYLLEDSKEYCKSIYIQFKKDFFWDHFVGIPELKGVRRVLTNAELGLKIIGKHKEKVRTLRKKITKIEI